MADANDPNRLEITHNDLNSPDNALRVQQLQQAASVPLIRNIGQPTPRMWYDHLVVKMLAAGLVGGLLAWGLIEMTVQMTKDDTSATRSNVLFTMFLGFGIGLVLAVWDGLLSGSAAKFWRTLGIAAGVLLVLTIAGGFLISLMYRHWVESIAANASSFDDFKNQLHFARGVAWALVGLLAGLGAGISSLKPQRIINGAVGGLIGGFIGGFMFDFIANSDSSAVLARAFGIALTGVLIGLGFGLIELARRQHWLEIVSGGMAGKQFIVYGARTSLGAAPNNDVTLIKDPAILPNHALLVTTGQGLSIQAQNPGAPVAVNGIPVANQQLRDGDTMQLGSTLLRYRNRSEVKIAAGPIVG